MYDLIRHNRFCGENDSNLIEASKLFDVKVNVPQRNVVSTAILIEGSKQNVLKAKKYFEQILGFEIGNKPLSLTNYDIVPCEVAKIQSNQNNFFRLVSKYGTGVRFPNNSTYGPTLIQGRKEDIIGIVNEFSLMVGRTIEIYNKKRKNNNFKDDEKYDKKSDKNYGKKFEDVIFFHPFENDENDFKKFLSVLNEAQKELDICVFSLTDNRIRYTIANLAKRGVKVNIITDNSQSESLGSDVTWLQQRNNITVKVDHDPKEESHMHHKFAIMDHKILLTGSFNWTWSASAKNYENICITQNKILINKYSNYFHKLFYKDSSIINITQYNKCKTKH